MRRAFNSEMIKDGVNLIGINLGSDFTSEHEWGIKGIVKSFDIKSDKLGIEGRKITVCPNTLYYQNVKLNNKIYWVLILSHYPIGYFSEDNKTKFTAEDIRKFGIDPYDDEFVMLTSWDDSSFGILVKNEDKAILDELYDAFRRIDIAVGVSPSHAFQNGGLKFVIISRLDKKTIDGIMENDLDRIRLKETAEKTGIYKLLEKTGKKYFALSPKWKDDNKKEVMFWLNPMEQHKYNYGWMNIEDLQDWANDKGKVMMKG